MTEIEVAQQRLDATRAARCWAGQHGDREWEQSLAIESHDRWMELERLKRK
jgi:hypothetical protein